MKYLISLIAIILAFYYLYRVSKYNGRVVKLIYFELIYNLIIKFIVGNLGLPSALNYISDMVLVWIAIEFIHQRAYKNLKIPRSIVRCTLALLIVSVFSYLINLYSPLLLFWGIRNNFRFIFYAMMCAVYLQKRDIETIMDILFGFFVLNILVVTYQFFFVTYTESAIGDFISGLYSNGNERGGNASLNWLMCIVCSYSITRYLNRSGSLAKVAFCLAGSVYMAALGEIKLFYLQILIIGFIAVAVCRKSTKVIAFSIVGIVGFLVGIRILYMAFPKFADFFTYENLMNYVTREGGYSSRGHDVGIDRLTVFSYVFKNMLLTIPDRLFGVGLGNADFSSFAELTSAFYKKYSWTGYTFFSSAFMTIELGVVGFITYLIYYANYIKYSLKIRSRNKSMESVSASVIHTTIIIGAMCFIMILSNQTLKMEASGYMVNCVLVFPFIITNPSDTTELGRSLIGRLSFRRSS